KYIITATFLLLMWTSSYAQTMKLDADGGLTNIDFATIHSYTAAVSEVTGGNATLCFDYIFAEENPRQTALNFIVSCLGATYDFESSMARIERNKLTTVQGNILTKGAKVNITINPIFAGNIDFTPIP
ncbi:MAG: hypothetical protein RSC34_02175, partial [Alistipes sp.]